MAGAAGRAGKGDPIAYDGDQKLLAFLGAVAFVLATLFWFLQSANLALAGSGLSAAALAAGVVSATLVLVAWGLRTKMQRGLPLTGWEVRRLLLAGLLLGVAVGALPYLALRFKLEDPDFMHVASEPENLPPAAP